MKKVTILILVIVLFVASVRLHKVDKKIDLQESKIDSLENIPFPIGFIVIGDTTLQVVTGFPERYLRIKTIHSGENFYNYTIRKDQRIELKVWNY